MEKPACLLVHNSTDPDSLQEEKKPFYLKVFSKDVQVKVPWPSPPPKGGLRSSVFEFSNASRRRLLHVCRNSGHLIKSQFCLTYHELWPNDGKVVKANLNHFLTVLKRLAGDIHYLWVLEFQQRGAPHIHFFSDIEATPEWRRILSNAWVLTVLGQSSDASMLKFHDHPGNFFPWNMKSGSYLSKEYIQKSVQKDVPENFHNVGRFWGCSRNMIPCFEMVEPDMISNLKPEIVKAVRVITRAHEKLSVRIARACQEKRRKRVALDQTPIKPIKKRNLRSKIRSYTVPLMAACFTTLFNAAIFGHHAGSFVNMTSKLDPFRGYYT